MGRHSRVEPKKVSFLGSTGGIFAALALAGGIFAVSQVTATPHEPNAKPPVERKIGSDISKPPANMVATATALANLPGPTEVPSTSTDGTRVIVPVPVPPEPTQPPTQNPSPNPSAGKPDVGVQAEVDTPILGVDTDVQVRVPLLGQAVDTVGDVVTGVTNPVANTVKDLLNK